MATVAEAATVLALFATGGELIGSVFGIAALVRLADAAGALAGLLEKVKQFMPVYRAIYSAATASARPPGFTLASYPSGAVPMGDPEAQTSNSAEEPAAPAPAPAATDPAEETAPPRPAPPPAPPLRKPRPVVPGRYSINNPESVTFFAGTEATVSMGGENGTNQDFLAHNVYGILQPIEWGPPTSAEQVMGPAGLASFSMSIESGAKYRQPVTATLAPNQAYVLYSWCIPSQYDLTDDIVRNYAMVGPIVYGCDPGDAEAQDAVRREVDANSIAEADYYVD